MARVVVRRQANEARFADSVHPVLARVYAQRGVAPHEVDYSLKNLLPASSLKDIGDAARVIADAVASRKKIVILADYDSDGCNGAVTLIRGLRLLGAENPGYVVPDRFKMGYGISPMLVDMAMEQAPHLLVCVDNGIVGFDGIAHANRLGVAVVVIDHHSPGDRRPDAIAIVNPHQPECQFGSKAPAAVGVAFYVLSAVKRRLVELGFHGVSNAPLGRLLPYVAIGTIGDVVPLDFNNRILVDAGLRQIRSQSVDPGLDALIRVAGVDPAHISAMDCGFKLVPRINAAGRMDDMKMGIELLLTDDPIRARMLASTLDGFNTDRKRVEKSMSEDAYVLLGDESQTGVVIFQEDFHEGVVGLVASRIKERLHRPAVVFARSESGLLKGSGRSIPGLHLRDAVARIDAAHPGMLKRWGGHAMALGLRIDSAHLATFSAAFDAVCKDILKPEDLEDRLLTDGELDPHHLNLGTAAAIESGGPFGQGFPEPIFEGDFKVKDVRLMGAEGQHVRYTVDVLGEPTSLVHFGGSEGAASAGQSISCAYKLGVNRWRGRTAMDLQLVERLS